MIVDSFGWKVIAFLATLTLSTAANGKDWGSLRTFGAATLETSFVEPNPDSLLVDRQPDVLGRFGAKLGLRSRSLLGGRLFAEFAAYGERSLGDDLIEDSEGRVNELHMIYDFGNSSIFVGRKRTEWGTGLVSSPTNIVSTSPSPIDPDDDFFRIEGRDVVQYTYTATDSSIDVLIIREADDARFLNDHSIAARYYTNFEGVDLSVVGGLERDGRYAFGANAAFTVGQSLELHGDVVYDSSAVRREPVAGNTGPIPGVRADAVSALVGGQWTAGASLDVILEYLYFQDGLRNATVAELLDNRIPLAGGVSGGNVGLRQTHYIFARLSRDDVLPDSVDLDLEYTLLQSIENLGGLHSLRATREIDGRGGAYVEAVTSVGGDDTELGQFPASSILRVGVELEF